CSAVCPKGVDPALGIQLLRGYMMGFSKKEKIVPKRYKPEG
ncbi:MAG: succinate dehydrogenase/fumarate reductase iron-sulfur subunit, partial [Nitrososphaerales archaeon]